MPPADRIHRSPAPSTPRPTPRPRRERRRRQRPRVGLAGVAAALLVAAVTTFATTTPQDTAFAFPVEITIDQPGPLGAVSVIGDSVLLGSAVTSPTLADRLAERGWGPIRMRAGEGYSTGSFPVRQSFDSTYWLGLWRSQGWDAPNVIVNLGANDSGFCTTNLTCARDAIMHVVDDIGPGHTIWWPQITRLYTAFPAQDTWNTALKQIAAERDDFHTWDWPAELPSYYSPDGTHLIGVGYQRRSARMAELFTLAVAKAIPSGTNADLPEATAAASSFLTLSPERIIDTRTDDPGRQSAGDTLRVDFGEALPDDATAVALYVAATRSDAPGYLSAGPCGQPNSGATVTYPEAIARGAPAITALGDDDDVCVFTSAGAHIIVDLQGAFVPDDRGLELDPLSVPVRLTDTRIAGQALKRGAELEITTPFAGDAVAVNIAAVDTSGPGFINAHTCGTPTSVANVNFQSGATVSSSAIVDLSDDQTFCVSSSTTAHVVVDATGVFRRDGSLSFVPVPPTRMLDTRYGTGGWSPIQGGGQTLDIRVAPPATQAVTGTLTIVGPLAATYLSADACTGSPPNASANAAAGDVIANSLTSAVTDEGRLCLLSLQATQTVFDTTGWWI